MFYYRGKRKLIFKALIMIMVITLCVPVNIFADLNSSNIDYESIDIEIIIEDEDLDGEGKELETSESNADLDELIISSGRLNPEFNPKDTEYTVVVENEVERVTVTAAAEDEDKLISGDGEIELELGDNKVTIEVKAADSETIKEYNITVTREEITEELIPKVDAFNFFTLINDEKKLDSPTGIAIDDYGYIYVGNKIDYANWSNPVNIKFDSNGIWERNFNDNSYQANGMGIDGSNVYVVNYAHGNMKKYDLNGEPINISGFEDIGEYATGIAIDGEYIYISSIQDKDRNPGIKVNRYNKDGTFVSSFGQGDLTAPEGIAINDDYIYVADSGQILRYDKNGDSKHTFVSEGLSKADINRIGGTGGLALDKLGNLYVVDTGNNEIKKFNPEGKLLSTWGEFGGGEGQFNAPWGIALDSEENIYVADTKNNRIQKLIKLFEISSIKEIPGAVYHDKDPVTIDYTIEVEFNKPIKQGMESMTLNDSGNNLIECEVKVNGNLLEIIPKAPLISSETYNLLIPRDGILERDNEYGLVEDYRFEFKTSDKTNPMIIKVDPEDNSASVEKDKEITIIFSKEIKEKDFKLITLKGSDNKLIECKFEVNKDTLKIDPKELLQNSIQYTLTISKGAITDILGNYLKDDYTMNFTTVEADIISPTIINTNPIVGGTDVEINKEISITFSESIKITDKGSITLKGKDDSEVTIKSIIEDKNILKVKFEELLKYENEYILTITKDAISDISDNELETDFALTFTTGKLAIPAIVSTSPVHNADGVELDKNILITFNKDMKAGDLTLITLKDKEGKVIPIECVINEEDAKVLNITLKQKLNYLNKYTLTIPQDAISDVFENKLDKEYILLFTTNEAKPISHKEINLDGEKNHDLVIDKFGNAFVIQGDKVVSYDRTGKKQKEYELEGIDNAEVLAIDNQGNIYFAEAYKLGRLNISDDLIEIWETDIGHTAGGITVDSDGNIYVVYTEAHKIIKYNSKGEIIKEIGSYGDEKSKFKRPRSIVIDKDGFMYVAESDNRRIQKLDLEGKYMADWELSKYFTTDDKRWSEPMALAVNDSGHLYIVTDKYDVLLLDTKGKFIKILDSELVKAEKASKVALDNFNNIYILDGINEVIHIIDLAPSVVKIKVENELVDDRVKTKIKILFNEAIDLKDEELITLMYGDEKIEIESVVKGDTLEISPKGLLKTDSKYKLTISVDSIVDKTGNHQEKDIIYDVKTTDMILPFMVRSYPKDKGILNNLEATFSIIFNEIIEKGEGFENIKLKNVDGTEIESIITTDESKVLSIKLKSPLEYETSYVLSIPKEGIVDLGGNNLEEDLSISFETYSEPDLKAPEVIGVAPENNAIGVEVDTTIVVSFNEKIRGGQNLRNIVLMESENKKIIPTTNKADGDKVIITLRETLLKGETKYSLILPKNSVEDLPGNKFAEKYLTVFTTGESEEIPVEPEVSSRPWEGGITRPSKEKSVAPDNKLDADKIILESIRIGKESRISLKSIEMERYK